MILQYRNAWAEIYSVSATLNPLAKAGLGGLFGSSLSNINLAELLTMAYKLFLMGQNDRNNVLNSENYYNSGAEWTGREDVLLKRMTGMDAYIRAQNRDD